MNNELIQSYQQQLPEYRPRSFWSAFGKFAMFASVAGLFLAIYYPPQTVPETVYAVFLCALLTFFIVYTLYRELNKRHRYSECIFYLAQNSHIVKDFLQEFRYGRAGGAEFDDVCKRLSDNISKCFTLLKGRSCNVCLKALNDDESLEVVARNTNSSNRYKDLKDSGKTKYPLQENTAFKVIFDDNTKEFSRYFLENDLPKLWKRKKYQNSSFNIVGSPNIKPYAKFFDRVSHWRLDYKSTLVVPIRHITTKEYQNGEYKYYWGFLCIDSKSRGIFNDDLDPELAFCFANEIFYLASSIREISKLNDELNYIWEQATQPSN